MVENRELRERLKAKEDPLPSRQEEWKEVVRKGRQRIQVSSPVLETSNKFSALQDECRQP